MQMCVHAMVDEGHAAVDAAPPAAAPASDWDAADATDSPTDAILGAKRSLAEVVRDGAVSERTLARALPRS